MIETSTSGGDNAAIAAMPKGGKIALPDFRFLLCVAGTMSSSFNKTPSLLHNQ
jgi:hypothetical protein